MSATAEKLIALIGRSVDERQRCCRRPQGRERSGPNNSWTVGQTGSWMKQFRSPWPNVPHRAQACARRHEELQLFVPWNLRQTSTRVEGATPSGLSHTQA